MNKKSMAALLGVIAAGIASLTWFLGLIYDFVNAIVQGLQKGM